jgi:hypothetical protein
VEIVVYPVGRGKYKIEGLDMRPGPSVFYRAARHLLGQGADPEELLEMRHRGSAIIAMRMKIGEAAKWMVSEGDKHGPTVVPFSKAFSRGTPALKDGDSVFGGYHPT